MRGRDRSRTIGSHVKFGILIGVLLSRVLVEIHEVAIQWTHLGKMGPPPPFGAWPLAVGIAAGLCIGILPRRARHIGQATALGAFAGLVGAMVYALLSLGFVEVDTPADYSRGMTRSLGIAIPLGSLLGAVCGPLYDHLAPSDPGKAKVHRETSFVEIAGGKTAGRLTKHRSTIIWIRNAC